MNLLKNFTAGIVAVGLAGGMATAAHAFGAVKDASMAKPGGFPDRPLTMIVPYGPGGGSGQVAAGMAKAVTELTGVDINRDPKARWIGHSWHDSVYGDADRWV